METTDYHKNYYHNKYKNIIANKKTFCDFTFNGKMRDNQNLVINSVYEKFGLDPSFLDINTLKLTDPTLKWINE
jgi:hypothetical protein